MSAELLNSKEAAEYLRIDDDTLLAYERAGLLSSVRYPVFTKGQVASERPRRTRLWRREELDRFLSSCEQKPDQEAGPVAGPISVDRRLQVSGTVGAGRVGHSSKKRGDIHWMEGFKRK